jgi:hypothetical protein
MQPTDRNSRVGGAGLGALILFYAFVQMLFQLIRGDIPKIPKH